MKHKMCAENEPFSMKKSGLVLALYMLIMGACLAVTRWGLRVSYSDQGFLSAMTPWVALLAALVLAVQFREKSGLWFRQKHGGTYGICLTVLIPVLLLAVYAAIECRASITPVMVLTPLLVGIAEEGMYRGILLPGLLKKKSVNTAIVCSAVWFSMLHLLNLLGGQSVRAVVSQLFLTFLTGLYFAAVYLRVRKLSLLILQHALWDFIAFSGVLERTLWAGLAVSLIVAMQLVFACAMLISNRGKIKLDDHTA